MGGAKFYVCVMMATLLVGFSKWLFSLSTFSAKNARWCLTSILAMFHNNSNGRVSTRVHSKGYGHRFPDYARGQVLGFLRYSSAFCVS
ncbi:hypothetical protein L873DRAFT_1803439 [Choiromyces venosus 120613-1]|uniref:Uncharacterized protein n=1 Tax=Choiromyces venosus 120613-1 TaxID=1336337 RepID=A0A3N4K6U8_9PEZI|nr:hypothetical protein L873DRAFT_1803439 [Choiromyces venosus 120613-1]